MSKIVNGVLVHDRSDVGPRRVGNRDIELTDKEKDATLVEWNANEASAATRRLEDEREAKIKVEMEAIQRREAVKALADRGEI